MKSAFIFSGVIFLSAVFFLSCKKEGTGGQATIATFPKHHDKPIKGATVYLKYGAKELPGKNASDYDLTRVGDANEDHIHIEELKWGDYFLYAVGYDSTSAKVVAGGLPVTIKRNERKGEINVIVPVSED